MTRYRLITPHGHYAPGTILDTDLPAGRLFGVAWPTARRLAELGVAVAVAEPPDDDAPAAGPHRHTGASRRDDASGPAAHAPERAVSSSRAGRRRKG